MFRFYQYKWSNIDKQKFSEGPCCLLLLVKVQVDPYWELKVGTLESESLKHTTSGFMIIRRSVAHVCRCAGAITCRTSTRDLDSRKWGLKLPMLIWGPLWPLTVYDWILDPARSASLSRDLQLQILPTRVGNMLVTNRRWLRWHHLRAVYQTSHSSLWSQKRLHTTFCTYAQPWCNLWAKWNALAVHNFSQYCKLTMFPRFPCYMWRGVNLICCHWPQLWALPF